MLNSLNSIRDACHYNAKIKGFHEDEHEFGTIIALIHSELSEALEADRVGDNEMMHEEIADVLIRVFDMAGKYDIDLDYQVERKMKINAGRVHKHGKKY